ncbi:hypothetical protein NPN19_25340, partial [Vibrio parahaemolyticus]|nr:hypothetical protein [Vibrio parahaemolyticus]
AEAAGENTIEGEPESRVSIEVAAPERNTETQGPDLFSPYVPSKASEGQEEEPQDQECELEAPGEGGVQVAEADPELDPEQKA